MNHLVAFAAASSAVLVAAIWQGALLAVVVAIALRLLPAVSAATRSRLWTATFALLVALHLGLFLHPGGEANLSGAPGPSLHVNPIWSVALALLWLAFALFRAAQMLLSAHRLRQISLSAVPVAVDPRHSERSEEPLYSALALSSPASTRAYTLCTSHEVDRPSVLGFFNPRILLPNGLLETLTPAELRQILLHETEHLRRTDDWTNLLQKLALVLFPLNPVLFWVERRMCLERELACDARVLAAGDTSRKSYALTLIRLAEHSLLRRGYTLALGLLGQSPRPSELSTRVHTILARPTKTLSRTQGRVAGAGLFTAVLALTATLAHVPSLVTFTLRPSSQRASDPAPPLSISAALTPLRVEASMQRPPQVPYRMLSVAAQIPAGSRPRLRKAHQRHRAASAPRVIEAAYNVQDDQTGPPPRLFFTAGGTTQVQQFVVPAVVYVPAAYAALRTPDGWIIFQL